VVDRAHDGVGRGGDEGAGLEDGTVGRAPRFPQAGETEGAAAGSLEEPWLTGAAVLGPLVETAGGDHAAALAEGVAEGRFGGEGFGAGVDDRGGGVAVADPRRHEAPVERGGLGRGGGRAAADGEDRGGRSDVVARRCGVAGLDPERGEGFADVFLQEDEARAHGRAA